MTPAAGLVARATLGLASLGILAMFFDVLRLVLCRFGVGSGVLLRGISGSLMIFLLWPWELDIVLEMLVGKYNTADDGIRLISIL